MRDPLILFAMAPPAPGGAPQHVVIPQARDAVGYRNYNAERGLIPGKAAGAPIQWDADVATIIHVVLGAHEFALA